MQGSPEERAKLRAARSGRIPVSHREYAQREVQVGAFERIASSAPAAKQLRVTSDGSAVPTAVRQVAGEVYKQQINLRHAFKKWDADGSGGLDVNEFTSALNSLGFSIDLESARALFGAFDIDGNGRIQVGSPPAAAYAALTLCLTP